MTLRSRNQFRAMGKSRAPVVGDVIAFVDHWGGVMGKKLERIHAERSKIIEMRNKTFDVAGEFVYVELVYLC